MKKDTEDSVSIWTSAMQKLPVVLFVTGVLVVVASVILGFFIVPNVIKNKITTQVQLANGTPTFEKWSQMRVPIYIKFRYFNITNPEEFANGQSLKPIFNELGPYVFRERREKFNITFIDDESKVKYRERIFYYFEPDLSTGNLDDEITFLNIPYYSVASKVAGLSFGAQLVAKSKVSEFNEQLFIKRKMREILFEGYKQYMIEAIEKLTGKKSLVNGTFGLFFPKNGTDGGEFEIHTGKLGHENFGQIVSWEGKTELNHWPVEGGPENNYCNRINGSEGSLFTPFLNKDSILRIFSPDLCRSIYLTYQEDIEYLDIPGIRFSVPQTLFQDGKINRENACFLCQKNQAQLEAAAAATEPSEFDDDFFGSSKEEIKEEPKAVEIEETCAPSGTVPLAACRDGAPVVMSNAHFLDGHENFLTDIEGVSKPNKETHQTFIDLEPMTGLMLRIDKRVQINVALKKNRHFDNLRYLPELIYPVLWLEESARLGEDTAQRIKSTLLSKKKQVEILRWAGIGIGVLLALAATTIILVRARKKIYHV